MFLNRDHVPLFGRSMGLDWTSLRDATADLFLVGAPIAFLAVLAVLFIKEKPLSTLSGDERLRQESALH